MPSAVRTELACLQDASRSAKARTDAIIAEVNAKYQTEWDVIMAKLEKRRWNEGEVK